MMVVALAMGVVATAQPSTVLPFASAGAARWSIAGSPSQTNELLVDGSPNGTWDGRLAYSTPQDAVQEVRVKAFDTDVAYGRTGAGTANQVLKSGTNSLHGFLYEKKNQPSNLVANNFFNNKNALPTQITHFNQYGVTANGAVFIPRRFDGRSRLFWFFAFEGLQSSSPNTTFVTVPTSAERQGDFSKLLTLSSPTVIYDPYSALQSGTVITRTAYPGNRIPASRLDPFRSTTSSSIRSRMCPTPERTTMRISATATPARTDIPTSWAGWTSTSAAGAAPTSTSGTPTTFSRRTTTSQTSPPAHI